MTEERWFQPIKTKNRTLSGASSVFYTLVAAAFSLWYLQRVVLDAFQVWYWR